MKTATKYLVKEITLENGTEKRVFTHYRQDSNKVYMEYSVKDDPHVKGSSTTLLGANNWYKDLLARGWKVTDVREVYPY